MEYNTKALKIVLRSDNIVEISTKEDWDQPDTLEVAKENAKMIKTAIGEKRMGILNHVSNTYISKEVMAYYDSIESSGVASALLTTSFNSKLVANAFLRFTEQSIKKRKTPVKVFNKRRDAISWLQEMLEQKN